MKELVCVTGANGFIASWLVKLLLKRGYNVRGLVRSIADKTKIAHLEALEGAKENLTLLKGDILDFSSLLAAFNGCSGVFHTACPVPSQTSTNPEVEVLDPAIKGTLNVLRACTDSKIQRVVVTSSGAAVGANPHMPEGTIVDENCWSDVDFCRQYKHWYMLGKTVGEHEAWTYANDNKLDMVVICPTLVLGPLLQSTLNSSCIAILKLLNSSSDTFEDRNTGFVDVRDVALAHILVYETPAATGRYLCSHLMMKRSKLVKKLEMLYPNYALPTKCIQPSDDRLKIGGISTKKLQDLGLTYTPFDKTLVDTVESLQEKGFLLRRDS